MHAASDGRSSGRGWGERTMNHQKVILAIAAVVAAGAKLGAAGVVYVGTDRDAGVSQAVVVDRGALAHTTQLLPLDKQGSLIGEGSADAQLAQVLFNLEAAL